MQEQVSTLTVLSLLNKLFYEVGSTCKPPRQISYTERCAGLFVTFHKTHVIIYCTALLCMFLCSPPACSSPHCNS